MLIAPRCTSLYLIVSKVEPCDPFMLMANSVQEVNFLLNPSTSGSKQIYVNVVGILWMYL